MINFKQYPNMTKCIIPDGTTLSSTNFSSRFSSMKNLKTVELPNSVTNLAKAFYMCSNLTTAVCGPNVVDMYSAYSQCGRLTTAVCGPKVNNMSSAYSSCSKIQGNAYFYSNLVSNVRSCFRGRSTENRLNIYVTANSKTNSTLTYYSNSISLVGKNVAWTVDTANSCKYNTAQNIYIYYVANVEEARIANGDPDYMDNL